MRNTSIESAKNSSSFASEATRVASAAKKVVITPMIAKYFDENIIGIMHTSTSGSPSCWSEEDLTVATVAEMLTEDDRLRQEEAFYTQNSHDCYLVVGVTQKEFNRVADTIMALFWSKVALINNHKRLKEAALVLYEYKCLFGLNASLWDCICAVSRLAESRKITI